MMQLDLTCPLKVGQKVTTNLYSRVGYVTKIQQQFNTNVIDIVWDNGTESKRLSQSIVCGGGAWKVHDEFIDDLGLRRMLNYVKTVDAENAAKEEEGRRAYGARTEQLKTEYAHLEQVKGSSQRITATKNIKTELKRTFPDMKFSITSKTFSMGDSIDVSWTDGPTAKDVSAVIDKYAYTSSDPFNSLFGDAKYVHANRKESFAFVARVVEQYNQTYNTTCTIQAQVYDGHVSAYVTHGRGDNGKVYATGAWETHGDKIRQLASKTACSKVLFCDLKERKEPKLVSTVTSKVEAALALSKLEIIGDLEFAYRDGSRRDDFQAKEVRFTGETDHFQFRYVLIGKRGAVYGLKRCRQSNGQPSKQMYAVNLSSKAYFAGSTPFDSCRFILDGDTIRYT